MKLGKVGRLLVLLLHFQSDSCGNETNETWNWQVNKCFSPKKFGIEGKFSPANLVHQGFHNPA